jgi:hypothetical protein
MKTEKDLQNYLRKEALRHGMTFDKIESRSRKGFPDCLLVFEGVVAFIEVKTPAGTGKLSASQDRVIEDLRDHGTQVGVVASQFQVDVLLKNILLMAQITKDQKEFYRARNK